MLEYSMHKYTRVNNLETIFCAIVISKLEFGHTFEMGTLYNDKTIIFLKKKKKKIFYYVE